MRGEPFHVPSVSVVVSSTIPSCSLSASQSDTAGGTRKDRRWWTTGSKPNSCCLPKFPSSNKACTCGSVGPRLERHAAGERGAAGITTPRNEASYPRGLLAGGAAPTLPMPERLCWGPAEMPLLCWVCAAGEEERVCGLLAAEALGVLLLLRFRTTELLQLCWRLGQACLSLHKRKLTLRVSSWGRFCSKGKLEHFDIFSLPVL